MSILKTSRLILRPWKEEDLEPFATLNADPRVMKYFPGVKSREESDASVHSFSEHISRCGWGFWAASLVETGTFIGLIGLQEVSFQAPFNAKAPAVEIGWRLALEHWGKGYATEGAKAALSFGFDKVGLSEIVSFTPTQNMRSRRVMEKIGMLHDPKGDFDHPRISPESPIRRLVLYRIEKNRWQKMGAQ